MTKEEAIKLYDSKFWEDMSLEDRAKFQLFESRLCMPFGIFHEATEKLLNRAVFSHEFAYPELLIKEYFGEKQTPTLDEIINLIPEEKRIIVTT